METLVDCPLSGEDEATAEKDAEEIVFEIFSRSVLRTNLLPHWRFWERGKRAWDLSGLGASSNQILPYRYRKWIHVNTDRMDMVHDYFPFPAGSNLPTRNGSEVSSADYVEEIVRGFESTYRFFQNSKNILRSRESVLHRLFTQTIRYVHQPTKYYHAVLDSAMTADALKDGVGRSIQIELLCRNSIARDRKHLWPLLTQERKSIEQMDIPFFKIDLSKGALVGQPEGQRLERFVRTSAEHFVFMRIAALENEDCNQQIGFIRGAFLTFSDDSFVFNKPEEENQTPFLERQQLIDQAILLGEELKRAAIDGADGSISWISGENRPDVNQFQLGPTGLNLYSGICGVSFFLSALHTMAPDRGYREMALSCLKPLRSSLKKKKIETFRSIGIGGFNGIGSLCYTLFHCARLLDEPSLVEDALRIVSLITDDDILKDQARDVTGGSAGLLLSLLAVYKGFPCDDLLERALLCGESLLQRRIETAAGHRVWKTFSDQPLTGFSHGVAGIAYALASLYRISGQSKYLEAAREGFAYERKFYLPEFRNWKDLRNDETNSGNAVCLMAWCHGAAGIGLARLGSYAVMKDHQINEEMEIAFETTRAYREARIDSLCCGDSGRTAILASAGRKLDRSEWMSEANRTASAMIHRAAKNGFRLLHNPSHGLFNPGLFKGLSGVGYSLLSLADDQGRIPCLLLLE